MFRKDKRSKVRRGGRKGAIILLMAIAIPVILVLAGFAVDLANIQRARTELRAATDLAAKAAADELSRTGDPGMARTVGINIASLNTVTGTPLTLQNSDFVFGRSTEQQDGSWTFVASATPLNSVQVTGRRTTSSADGPIGLFFGNIYGRPDYETSFAAVATFVDVDICLVLDRSSSMKLDVDEAATGMSTSDPRWCLVPNSTSRWAALDQAVGVFTSTLQATTGQEKVAVVTFGSDTIASQCVPADDTSTVTTDLGLTFTLSQVDSAMDARSNSVWNGRTDIAAGIQRGINVLTGPQSRSTADKIMIVLTDGVHTEEDPVPQAVAANSAGIVVHTITFGDAADQVTMQSVANAGGGDHYHASDGANLNSIFQQLAAAVAIVTQ